mmetsp:Transcript_1621/g.3382  ORF Transcript_1621/g.3382 Transcript_1621/m.3382 type:complete len:204 (-) Transcript_1621:838-1449(-)
MTAQESSSPSPPPSLRMNRLLRRLPCCSIDPSNPCRPRDINQSGYWLLISMVLLAFVMVVPLLKGLLHLISAYMTLVIFACIFCFRNCEAMAVLAASSVAIAHTFFGVAVYIHYATTYGSCESLLLIGVRSNRNMDFCHENSFKIISIVCGCVWMVIAGCLYRFVELRRTELARENLRQHRRQQQQVSTVQEITGQRQHDEPV